MNNLLKMTAYRLRRSKLFYLLLAAVLILALFIIMTNAPVLAELAEAGEEDHALEDCYYNLTPMLGFAFAAFISLFLGTEYADGTIRNKLIAGHRRSTVFLSFYFISALACLCMSAVYLIGGLPGLLYFDGFGFGWGTYALWAAALACSALLFAAIFTAVSMLIPNRAVSAVVSLGLWFGLLFLGSAIINLLSAPEMTEDFAYVNGAWVAGEPYPNPNYIGGTKRTILEALNLLNPVCPAIEMSNGECAKPIVYIIAQLGMSVVTLFAGCMGFRKKDLK